MKKIGTVFFICFLLSGSSYSDAQKFMIKPFYVVTSDEHIGVCVIAKQKVEIFTFSKNCKRIKGAFYLISNNNKCFDFSEEYSLNISKNNFSSKNQFRDIEIKEFRKCRLKKGEAICFLFPKALMPSDELRISYFEATSKGIETKEEIFQVQRASLDTFNLGTNFHEIEVQVSH